MCDFSQDILDEAYQIGYDSAAETGTLLVPAFCDELTDLVRRETAGLPAGSSLPLYQQFGAGQAAWFHDETVAFCEGE